MRTVDILFTGSISDGYHEYLEPVIFRPWAERLVARAGLVDGQTVLDVAAGTGAVSRLAATRVGPSGRVIASDISEGMLTQLRHGYPEGGPPLETLVCSASALDLPDAAVDTVLCQQGLQFFPDKSGAVREMARVLKPAGTLALAVWLQAPDAAFFFMTYGDAIAATGIPEPFPGAYDPTIHTMTTDEVADVFASAELEDVEISVEELELHWPDVEHAARGVFGTPYGTVLAGLDHDLRARVMDDLVTRMTGDDGKPTSHVMAAVIATARRPDEPG